MSTFKPRPGAWVILAVICAPIAMIGAANLILNPSGWVYSALLFAGALGVVGYNFTARLVIDAETITLSRYGRVVWSTQRSGVRIKDGYAGDIPILPSIVLWRDGRQVGFVAKAWFSDRAITELRNAPQELASDSGPIETP